MAAERYEGFSRQINEVKEKVGEYESRLRYANDVITNFEGEN